MKLLLSLVAAAGVLAQARKPAPLEEYILEATRRASGAPYSPGSLFTPVSRLADLGRDFRALQLDDVVTVIVADRASALARGTTNTTRSSRANATVTTLAGPVRPAGPLGSLLDLESERQLQGQGVTSREMTLNTTLSARVAHLLPNGHLVLEAVKDVSVNSERQQVVVRGVARPEDISPLNQIRSDRLAFLEVRIAGKGVVEDAIRRPNLLYRILLGLLPF